VETSHLTIAPLSGFSAEDLANIASLYGILCAQYGNQMG
jgi:hypothetical protein